MEVTIQIHPQKKEDKGGLSKLKDGVEKGMNKLGSGIGGQVLGETAGRLAGDAVRILGNEATKSMNNVLKTLGGEVIGTASGMVQNAVMGVFTSINKGKGNEKSSESDSSILLTSDEVIGINYNSALKQQVSNANEPSHVFLEIEGKLLAPIDVVNDGSGMLENLTNTLGLGTMMNKFKAMGGMDKLREVGLAGEGIENSNLQLAGGKGDINGGLSKGDMEVPKMENDILKPSVESMGDMGNSKEATNFVKDVMNISPTIPLGDSFVSGAGKMMGNLFGNKNEFNNNDLYTLNRNNVAQLMAWGTSYGKKDYRDVLVQVSIGNGEVSDMFFPSMYVESFNHQFDVKNGVAYFKMMLKQKSFNQEQIKIK